MVEKTKPPRLRRVVVGDDLPVVANGEVYHPHAGEWVEFKARPTMELYLEVNRLGETEEAMQRIVELLSEWDWTDDEGNAYTNPPEYKDILKLPPEEFRWLLQHAGAEVKPDSKNFSTLST